MSPTAETHEAVTRNAKALGIGRGIRAPQARPPLPTKATGLPTGNAEFFEENRAYLNDIVSKFRTKKMIPSQEDICAEFSKLTGNPIEDVASAFGFNKAAEMVKHMCLDLQTQDRSSSTRRARHRPVAAIAKHRK